MDDAALASTGSVFLFIACINNHPSVQRRTVNWWLLDFDIAAIPAYMWSAQGRSCKVRVYIFIYVCIYNIPELSVYWILRAVHPHSLGMSASRRVTWHLNACGGEGGKSEGVTASPYSSFCRLCLVFPSLSLLRSLFFCSSVTGGWRVASGFCSGWMYRSPSQVKVHLY